MRRAVIVGGSLAGVHAAEELRSLGYEGEITLVSAETYLPYDRPPLSKEGLLTGVDHDKVLLRPEGWYEQNQIDVRLDTRAVGLSPGNKELILDGGERLDYDGLVIASGSRARRLPTSENAPAVHVVRNFHDAQDLRKHLRPGRRLILIGAGFIGLEIAATARQLDVEVTVVEVAQVPLSRVLGDAVGSWYRDLHSRNGVTVECGSIVNSLEETNKGAKVHLGNGKTLHGDVIVAGIGATPATEWLEGSGIALSDGVRCGPDLSTNAPGVVAAGDLARWYNPVFDEEMRVEHWTNAVEHGRRAATTLLGSKDAHSSVPYFWTDQYDAKMRFVGRADAADDVVIERRDGNKLVALYGRDGVIRGAVCVNSPRQLAAYRKAIKDQVPWRDIAPKTSAVA